MKVHFSRDISCSHLHRFSFTEGDHLLFGGKTLLFPRENTALSEGKRREQAQSFNEYQKKR